MYYHRFALHQLQDTTAIAQKIAPCLQPGDVLALFGDLGSGKTTFSRYLLQSFGFQDIPSPTFTLLQTYPTDHTTFYHFDLYRLHQPEDSWNLGIEEAFTTGTCLIEWPERLGALLPMNALSCYFELGEQENDRFLTLKGSQNWQRRLQTIFIDKY